MCFVFVCLNSRIILIVCEKSFWNFLLRWELILFNNFAIFITFELTIWWLCKYICADPGVRFIYLILCCGFEKSEQLDTGSCARRWYTPMRAGGLLGILYTIFSALVCLWKYPWKLKNKIIYLPTDPVIWFIGSASVSLKATLFIYCNWGGSACTLDVVGLHRLYKQWAAKQRLNVALCSLIRINGTRLPSALQ